MDFVEPCVPEDFDFLLHATDLAKVGLVYCNSRGIVQSTNTYFRHLFARNGESLVERNLMRLGVWMQLPRIIRHDRLVDLMKDGEVTFSTNFINAVGDKLNLLVLGKKVSATGQNSGFHFLTIELRTPVQ